jgi:hypothetical protein
VRKYLLTLTLGTAVIFLWASVAAAGDVVVLRGGTRIELKQPPVRQGNNVLLTRADGTLFSVPDSEIDWKGTAAAKKEPAPKPAPAIASAPETPAEAARQTREAPKTKVKITDADVDHIAELPEAAEAAKNEAGPRSATARLEVADYSQEKSASGVIVRGNLRNTGATSALGVSLSVSGMDASGKGMGSAPATLSKGDIESGESVAFSAILALGDKVPDSIRFTPTWRPAPTPAVASASPAPGSNTPAAAGAATGAPAAPDAKSAAPPPAPTPYGRGVLYANPAAAAPSSPPADGKNGYIPGAARKEDQPKPPE